MSEREELEAVIDGLRAAQKRLYDDAEPHEGGRPFGAMVRGADAMGEAARKLKTLSGYTKGNGELVEAVRSYIASLDEQQRIDDDPRSFSEGSRAKARWKLKDSENALRKALSDSEAVAPSGRSGRSGGDDGRELIPVEVLQKAIEIQTEGRDMHPLTCPNRGDAHHAAVFDNGADIDVGTLMPTSAYLVCVACGYQQGYSHPAAQFLLEAARSAASRASHQWRPS